MQAVQPPELVLAVASYHVEMAHLHAPLHNDPASESVL